MSDRAATRDSAPAGTLGNLLAILDLRRLRDAADQDVFVGQSQRQPWGRVYGGQVVAQALVAAQRTVEPARAVHSMHAYFLRAGDDTEAITFSVERLRDGHSFSARRVHALQFGRPILALAASFQTEAAGADHGRPMPRDVPDPLSLPTLQERYGHLTGESVRHWLRERPMDLRHVYEPAYLVPAPDFGPDQAQAEQMVWMKAHGEVPDDPALHAALLAYASDYAMLEPVLRRHGRTFAEPGMKIASLDHAMWFHRPARVDQWLLHVLDSPSAQGARGLGRALVYTADGVLVASVAQEGMVRLPA
jgi:acyl-CoA thioesterase-2